MMGSSGGFMTMQKCADDKLAIGSDSAAQTWSHRVNDTIDLGDMARNSGFDNDPDAVPQYTMQIVQHTWYYQQAGQMYLLEGESGNSAPTFSIVKAGYPELLRYQIHVDSFGVSGCLHVATKASDPQYPPNPDDAQYEQHD